MIDDAKMGFGENDDKISVVMSVYNTNMNYLMPAIDSIINQTYKNIEFVIVDDCSDEWCADVLKKYSQSDDRIVLVRNSENIGITKSLNVGLEYCTGKYVARMDSDDISLPNRLERQMRYLQVHEEVHVLSCVAAIYEEEKICYTGNRYHINPDRITNHMAGLYRTFEQETIRVQLAFGNIVFTHPTVMYRKSFLDKYNIKYDELLDKAQDYALWCKAIEYRCMDSLQEVLFIYRNNSGSATNTVSYEQARCSSITKLKQLKRIISNPTSDEIDAYLGMAETEIIGSPSGNVQLAKKIIELNSESKVYPDKEYRDYIVFRLFRKCLYGCNRKKGIRILMNIFMLRNCIRVVPFMSVRYLCDYVYKKEKSTEFSRTVRKKLKVL